MDTRSPVSVYQVLLHRLPYASVYVSLDVSNFVLNYIKKDNAFQHIFKDFFVNEFALSFSSLKCQYNGDAKFDYIILNFLSFECSRFDDKTRLENTIIFKT